MTLLYCIVFVLLRAGKVELGGRKEEIYYAGFTDNEESVNLNDVVSYILSNR